MELPRKQLNVTLTNKLGTKLPSFKYYIEGVIGTSSGDGVLKQLICFVSLFRTKNFFKKINE